MKIDAGVVRGVDGDISRQAVIAGLVHFAAFSGATCVAEGIETRAEAVAVARLGVELGQGYLFGRPARVAAWMTNAAPRSAIGRKDRREPFVREPVGEAAATRLVQT